MIKTGGETLSQKKKHWDDDDNPGAFFVSRTQLEGRPILNRSY
ncbi:hypothetical protein IWT25_00293 [Secundilactobacillus pentosiphilus]|uniref:Uncharacterized protein n=1 Tax=Secundilactobacillus pentosiphilus TaxID=1714682 RepID=A0A1Z5IU64_9LACO|nr:hypothetical protein IWT25_00293 [Secundilactobacillus pentosiphilus]